MAYRMFDTTTWADPWFKQLSEPAKLLFIYLWTNERCNAAGMYRLDKQIMLLESGLNGHKPDVLLGELGKSVIYDGAEEVIWVKNFFRRQCQNASFCKSAIKALKSLPEAYGAKFCQHNSKTFKSFNIKAPSWQGGDTVLTAQHSTATVTAQISPSSKEEEAFSLPIEEEIDKLAEQMKPTWKQVFAFANAMRKKKKHPGAIFLALTQVAMHEPKEPWPYAKNIVEIESQNFYEQDYAKESAKHKEKR